MLKYQLIANDIRDKIMQGIYQPDDQLPLTGQLETSYQASKMTIKRALDHLEAEGIIVKCRGCGTFVKGLNNAELNRLTQHSKNQLLGMTKIFGQKRVSNKIIAFEVIPASTELANKLCIESETFVYHIQRVRSLDAKPLTLEESFMPIAIIPNLRRNHAEKSIFAYITNVLGLKIKSAHRLVKVRLANETECQQLKLTASAPVAITEELYFLDNGTPFNFSITTHESDHFALESVIVT